MCVSNWQELARARASQRVLARNSRSFLDGKQELQKEREKLEAQVKEGGGREGRGGKGKLKRQRFNGRKRFRRWQMREGQGV